ncbi:MAG: hypothetical protein M1374_02930 [Firmicutes bacterium]|jgi:hypothetical protein|nr:hypothetical protein [Bacillota bacterium]
MWWNKRAVGLHATLLIVLPIFSGLADWQLSRALGGNSLSWVYTFEWPFFGFYAIVLWWKLIHEDEEKEKTTGLRFSRKQAKPKIQEDELEAETAAYNNYLSSLYQNDGKTTKT